MGKVGRLPLLTDEVSKGISCGFLSPSTSPQLPFPPHPHPQVYLLSVPKEGEPLVAAAPSTDNPFVSQLCRVLGASSGGGGSSGGGSSGVGLSTGRAAAALSRGPSMTMQPLAG